MLEIQSEQLHRLTHPALITLPNAHSFQSVSFRGAHAFAPYDKMSMRFGYARTRLDSKPLNTLFSKVSPLPLETAIRKYATDTKYVNALQEVAKLGHSELSFPALRKLLLSPDGMTYDMEKLVTILSLASGDTSLPIQSFREKNQSPYWIEKNVDMVEYVNIRALGIGDPTQNSGRFGNILDALVYALQSRGVAFHVAPFHPGGLNDHLYLPRNLYRVNNRVVSRELLTLGINDRSQIKLFNDFCHAREKEPMGTVYETLPQTADLSVDYLYRPEAARWIQLNPEAITSRSRKFDDIKSEVGNQHPKNDDETGALVERVLSKLERTDLQEPVMTGLADNFATLSALINGTKVRDEEISPELKDAAAEHLGTDTIASAVTPKENFNAARGDVERQLRERITREIGPEKVEEIEAALRPDLNALARLAEGQKIRSNEMSEPLWNIVYPYVDNSQPPLVYKAKPTLADKQEDIKNVLRKLTVRKALVLATQLAEEDIDVRLLRAESERQWNSHTEPRKAPLFEAKELILEKDSRKIAKTVRRLVRQQVNPEETKRRVSYEMIEASENKNYDDTIAAKFRRVNRIYNLPVGSWCGLQVEFVGFNKEHNYPIFTTRQNAKTQKNEDRTRLIDTSHFMFGTMSRLMLNLENGVRNWAGIKHLVNAIKYWGATGFDALRTDQTDHPYNKTKGIEPIKLRSGQTLSEHMAETDQSFDTMLKASIGRVVEEARRKLGKSLWVLAEFMMLHHEMSDVDKGLAEVRPMGINAISGKFQYIRSLKKLMIEIAHHNRVRKNKGIQERMISAIENHDMDIIIGTSPAAKSLGGLRSLRTRFVLNAIGGVPYVTTQAMQAVDYDKQTSHAMSDSIREDINLAIPEESPEYAVGDTSYSWNDFRHNYFDFIRHELVRPILKDSIITPMKITSLKDVHEGDQPNDPTEKLLAFTVTNNDSDILLFVNNISGKPLEDITLEGVPENKLPSAGSDVSQFILDRPRHGVPLEPVEAVLPMDQANTLHFDKLASGEMKIYRYRAAA